MNQQDPNKKLYVGNLPYSVDDDGLRERFQEFGTVNSAKVITDRETGKSKGFGFIEMESVEEAQAAIDSLNGAEFQGRKMVVNEARPRPPRENNYGNSRY